MSLSIIGEILKFMSYYMKYFLSNKFMGQKHSFFIFLHDGRHSLVKREQINEQNNCREEFLQKKHWTGNGKGLICPINLCIKWFICQKNMDS